LFTIDGQIGADVADMFNYLTGFGRPTGYRKVLVAPNHLRDSIIEEIDRTIAAHAEQSRARIAMKMNALVDQRCIEALYRASQAGVRVDLNIRGICCLRPGVEGVSDNIRVVSIVGRFLEHSRIFAFERGDEQTVYIASADLMPRNLDTRVELAVPIEDPKLREEVLDDLERCLADERNAWELHPDGRWRHVTPRHDPPRDVHRELMALHIERAQEAELGARAARATVEFPLRR
jgi:polyphosphate kinase